jgi:hypothetical protein
MTRSTPRSARSYAAQIAALSRHSKSDGVAATSKAREAFNRRFLDEVDPERLLSEVERARRAAIARRLYFVRLSAASARARARLAGSRRDDDGRVEVRKS